MFERFITFAAAVTLVVTMPLSASAATTSFVVGPRPGPPIARTGCPYRAAYLRLGGEIRGYQLDGFGVAHPCARLGTPFANSYTPTSGYGAIVFDSVGDLHVTKFQDNGYDAIVAFEPLARGDERPYRSVGGFSQDHVAFAVDPSGNDYLVAGESYENDNCWFFAAASANAPTLMPCDPALSSIKALAMTAAGELVVAGPDALTQRDRIDVFANAGTASPRLVRSIAGPSTGLAVRNDYFAPLALAIDPTSGDVYAYVDDANGVPHVLAFAARASGDARPIRELHGPAFALGIAFATDPIAVDDRHQLYAVLPSGRIVVFAAGAAGLAAPIASIDDPSILQPQFAIGLALRTSRR